MTSVQVRCQKNGRTPASYEVDEKTEKKIVELYVEDGLTFRQIQIRLGVSILKISHTLHKNGVRINSTRRLP